MDTSFERSSASDDWITPPHLLKLLGEFDLDPCACTPQPFRTAKREVTIAENGLTIQWKGRVFCNPPYGRKAEAFIKKLAEHGDGILLIFARVETRTWLNHIWPKADAVLFLKGRLRFYHPDGTEGGTAGSPSALIAYGKENARILQLLDGKKGKYLQLR